MSEIFRQKDDGLVYDLSNISVMLVEDSVYLQNLLSSMLRTFGVKDVLICSGGNEAIDLLKIMLVRQKSSDVKMVDIILTDWLMPDGDGVDLIKFVRGHEEEALKFMPVILVSAYISEQVLKIARDTGANEALIKPLSGAGLASRILTVIDHPRPFVKAPGYFGPDRRRQDVEFKGRDRRHTNTEAIKVHDERLT